MLNFIGINKIFKIFCTILWAVLLITVSRSAYADTENLLSIGAIDFGIIVDIPLIFIEDYFRLSRKFGTGTKSIIKASEEIGRPIIFSVIIILEV